LSIHLVSTLASLLALIFAWLVVWLVFWTFAWLLASFFSGRSCLFLQKRRAWGYNTLYNLMGYIVGIRGVFLTWIHYPLQALLRFAHYWHNGAILFQTFHFPASRPDFQDGRFRRCIPKIQREQQFQLIRTRAGQPSRCITQIKYHQSN